MDCKREFEIWRAALSGNPQWSGELAALEKDDGLLEDSFYKHLEFGTAGMRGTLGLGTNRMNIYTVRRCTQGVADCIKAQGKESQGVAIAYDSRRKSDEFALETALVLAANGIKVYLYESIRSVPQLSFTVLNLHCINGIVITASHNPPEYNGYKVYGEDGGQLAIEDAATMTDYINQVEDIFSIPLMDKEEAIAKGLLNYIGEEIDEQYYAKVKALVIDQSVIDSQADTLKIVYTPLFGTGNRPVRRLLTDIGIKNLAVVHEQEEPNGDFPGLSAPNPENREVYGLAFRLAESINANMIMATDPDCDRLGVAVKRNDGEWQILTGNQIGCLLMDYILSAKQKDFKGDEFVVKSLVSTPMADAIAAHYGVEMRSVLTGFRFIAEQIKLSEQTGQGTFCFGFEESYGFLEGTFLRDKDAAMSAMFLAETACSYAARGMTLYDAICQLYAKYGYYQEKVLSLALEGIEGIEKIQGAVEKLRQAPPKSFGDFQILAVADFKTQVRTDMQTGQTSGTGLPVSDVLYYELENGRLILRPSGTEPKLKAYVSYYSKEQAEAEAKLAQLADIALSTMKELTK